MSKVRSPLKRLGGKANMARWICQRLPEGESYVEVFGGGAGVLFRKERSKGQEVYNDLDGLWVNSMAMIRDHGEQVADLIAATPYSRQEFLIARDTLKAWRKGTRDIDPLELATLHLIDVRQSYSADGGWSTTTFGGQ